MPSISDSTIQPVPVPRLFSEKRFSLLGLLPRSPLRETYKQHHQEFLKHVEHPLQQQLQKVRDCLLGTILESLETRNWIYGDIPKNAWEVGRAFDFYWGAFYPKEGRRSEEAQLFLQPKNSSWITKVCTTAVFRFN